MERELICTDCNMLFHSFRLLEKHKALFCIGSEVGHPRGTRHHSEASTKYCHGGITPKLTRNPDLMQLAGQQRGVSRLNIVDAKPESQRANNKPATAHKGSSASQSFTKEPGHTEWLKEMSEMATLHERQLALIHAHNQQLEQQRDELAQQVSILAQQSDTTHLERLLTELREQEERNEETLQQLAEHLRAFHVQEGVVPSDPADPHKEKNIYHNNDGLIHPVDGSLSTRIIALRQAYVHSGRCDSAIVAQMIDLQAEAQSLEKNQRTAANRARKKNVKPRQWSESLELLVLEQENQKLESEIIKIQLARDRHCGSEERGTRKEALRRSQPLSLRQKSHIHAPLSLLKTSSFSPLPAGFTSDALNCLGPAPYNPVSGFLVLYDLVLAADASQKALRLVSALHAEGQEVGRPTLLPPVHCTPGASLSLLHNVSPRVNVLLAVKQCLPRIQPSPSLSLVVEVQTASVLDVYNQEVFKLRPCGWIQLQLFDQYNQLHSGHWRVPVRSLPINPSLSIAQLNSIPQVGNMELCLRLVNSRDEDVQMLARPDPCSTGHYRYPAAESSLPAKVHERDALPVSQGADQLSASLLVTDQDPSTTDETQQHSYDGNVQSQ